MSNARESKKETGKRGKISLKSNWRMSEREQEKMDAELATSGEERSQKQQTRKRRRLKEDEWEGEGKWPSNSSLLFAEVRLL